MWLKAGAVVAAIGVAGGGGWFAYDRWLSDGGNNTTEWAVGFHPDPGEAPDLGVPQLYEMASQAAGSMPPWADLSNGFVMRLDDDSAAVFDHDGWAIVQSSGEDGYEAWRPGMVMGAVVDASERRVLVPSAELPPAMLVELGRRLEQVPGLAVIDGQYVVADEGVFDSSLASSPPEGMEWRNDGDDLVLTTDFSPGIVNVIAGADRTWIVSEDVAVLALPDPAGDGSDVIPVGSLSSCARSPGRDGCAGRPTGDTAVFWEPFPGADPGLVATAEGLLAGSPGFVDTGAGLVLSGVALERRSEPSSLDSAGIWADVDRFLQSGADVAWVDPAWPSIGDPTVNGFLTLTGEVWDNWGGGLVWDQQSTAAAGVGGSSDVVAFAFDECECNWWTMCGNCAVEAIIESPGEVVREGIRISGEYLDQIGDAGIEGLQTAGGWLENGVNATLDLADWLVSETTDVAIDVAEGGRTVVVRTYEMGTAVLLATYEFAMDTWQQLVNLVTYCDRGCGAGPPTADLPAPGGNEWLNSSDPAERSYGAKQQLAQMWFPYLQFAGEETCGSVLGVVADVFPYTAGGMRVEYLEHAERVEITYTVFYEEDGGRMCLDRHAGDNEGFGIGLRRTSRTEGRCASGFELVGARSSAHLDFDLLGWVPDAVAEYIPGFVTAVSRFLGERYVSHISHDSATAAELGACPPIGSPGSYVALVSEDKHGTYFHEDVCEAEIPGIKQLVADALSVYTTVSSGDILFGAYIQQFVAQVLEDLPGDGGLEECDTVHDPVDLSGWVVAFRDDLEFLDDEYALTCRWTVSGKRCDSHSYRDGLRGRWRPDSEWPTAAACGTWGQIYKNWTPRDESDHDYHVDGLFDDPSEVGMGVPNVVGMTLDDACVELARWGLIGRYAGDTLTEDPALEGLIVSQSPGYPSVAAFGTVVDLGLGDYMTIPPEAITLTLVPDVVNKPELEAIAQIEFWDLVAVVALEEVVDPRLHGIVIRQDPQGSALVPEGSLVTIVVARFGPPNDVQVPNVVGMCFGDAVAALDEVDLGSIDHDLGRQCGDHNSTCSEVTAQSPVAGSWVIPGTDVRLTNVLYEVCDRPVTCNGLDATIKGTEGPDVIYGTEGRDVIAALGGNDAVMGFQGNDVICGGEGDDVLLGGDGDDQMFGEGGNDSLEGEGGIDSCDGGTGTDYCDGETATSCEDAPVTGIQVPNVVGMCDWEAFETLQDAGLNYFDDFSRQCGDHDSTCYEVIGQDPPSGTWVAPGTQVIVTNVLYEVCQVDVQVPDVLGMCDSDAFAAIEAAGLTYEYDASVQCGDHNSTCFEVTGLDPPPGSWVPEGTTVTVASVYYEICPELVTLPDMFLWCWEDAIGWLSSHELTWLDDDLGRHCPDFLEDYGIPWPDYMDYNEVCWVIVEQWPSPGAQIATGSDVTLTNVWLTDDLCEEFADDTVRAVPLERRRAVKFC